MTGDGVSFAPLLDGALDDVYRGPVMLDHVDVGRREIRDIVAEVPGETQGLQEHLRHDHGAAEIQHNPAMTKVCDRCRKNTEIPKGCRADSGSVGRWMLMDDVRANGDMQGIGNAFLVTAKDQGAMDMGRIFIGQQGTERHAKAFACSSRPNGWIGRAHV